MSFHISAQTFDLYPLRFKYGPLRTEPITANLLRGALGSALKKVSERDYERFFAPKAGGREKLDALLPSNPTPSGLADWPRPFVFRLSEPGVIGMNVFATQEPAVEIFIHAMKLIDAIAIDSIEGTELLHLPLASVGNSIRRVRVRFVTPTELKGMASAETSPGIGTRPEFGALIARIRDRVSTLRSLWGEGPLEIDFKALGERAARVNLTRCELIHSHDKRISRASGKQHSLGGFTGIAEYELVSPDGQAGNLAEFLPYLEIAGWTGVGRQTVWGKGEIAYETF